ncbi:hypothetical protein VQ7734_03604 [Vibrio quintilis]|uniref:Uncharacterized protein n=2 Tax=Vibrio quintilis TaxID=1117707 RepID=A0A1M7YZ24_9VIBR|nr:hypothetical protein VQ7734_03604 [Vibrio quintilis]
MQPYMTDNIEGAKGSSGKSGQSSGRVAKEDPNTLQSNATCRCLFLVSEGPTIGPERGAQDILIDGTPLQSEQGSYNFQGVHLAIRQGHPQQEHLPGFPAVENQVSVGTEVTFSTPVIRTIHTEIDAARVTVRIPRLTSQDAKTGDLHGSSVGIYIDSRAEGGSWTRAVTDTIKGKTVSDYQRDYRVELTGEPPWDIRVGRISPDSTSSTLSNQTYWDSYTEITDAKLYYPNSALLGLTIDAKQFSGSMPKVSAVWSGMAVKVPANYDPQKRTYQGIWDGTFQVAWTDNPAWVLYDLLTNTRYGLGQEVDHQSVSKGHFYTIGQYCDELVDDGYGGKEPRYTCNIYLAKQQDAFAVVKNLATVFRGMTYWGSGQVVPVQDAPQDATQLITAANVVDGLFTYKGKNSSSERHSVALVSWNDPEDNYRLNVEVVEDKEAIQAIGWKTTDVVAVGCTSRGQARRVGRWTLDAEWHEPETITYRCGFDQLGVRPGDIVNVLDPDIAGIRLGGRIAGVTPGAVTVDELPADFDPALAYQLSVVLPSGGIHTTDVQSVEGNTLSVATMDVLPVAGAMWALTTDQVQPRPFRVTSVTEAEDMTFNVTGTRFDPHKYQRVEDGIRFEDSSFSLLPSGALPPPKKLTIDDNLYIDKGQMRTALTIGATLPADARIRYIEYQYQSAEEPDFTTISTTSSVSVEVKDVQTTTYTIRARCVDALGQYSRWSENVVYQVLGKQAPPEDVDGFSIQVTGATALLSWQAGTDLDLDHYKVRYSPQEEGAKWGEAVDIVTHTKGTSASVPALVGSYLVKAVDTSGNESVNAAWVSSSVSSLAAFNVIESVQESPAFSGRHLQTCVLDHALQSGGADSLSDWPPLEDISSLTYAERGVRQESIYAFKRELDLGEVYTSRLTAVLKARGVDIRSTMSTWNPIGKIHNLIESSPNDWSVRLQVRTTKDAPSSSEAVWSSWQDFVLGDYTARAFQWRVILLSYNPIVAAQVTALEVQVDMPDRIASDSDLVCPQEGRLIRFASPFRARPAIAVDAQEMAPGDYKMIREQSRRGFYLQFFNQAGQPVARSFDYLAKGYGQSV